MVERRSLHHAGCPAGGLRPARVGAIVVALSGVVGMVAYVVPAVVLRRTAISVGALHGPAGRATAAGAQCMVGRATPQCVRLATYLQCTQELFDEW